MTGLVISPPALEPLHLGALHPVETLAMAVLALGPFLILAAVVTVVSRRDRRAEAREAAQATRDAPRDSRPDRPDAKAPTNDTATDTAAPHSVQQ